MKRFDVFFKQQLSYVVNSGITVKIDHKFETVEICDNQGRDIFLQGQDGHEFIMRVRELENEFICETSSDCALIAAYPYADLLSEC